MLSNQVINFCQLSRQLQSETFSDPNIYFSEVCVAAVFTKNPSHLDVLISHLSCFLPEHLF